MPKPPVRNQVPFIKVGEIGGSVFSEVGGAGGVDNPASMAKGWNRPPESPASAGGEVMYEASVGTYVTSPAGLLQVLAERRRAVAIIKAQGANFEADIGDWTGTGVIVGRNLLLTNHHVIHAIETAREARIEFDFEISPADLLSGNIRPPEAARSFALDPDRLFVTSPTRGGLDYTFIWIEDAAAASQGIVPMDRSAFTVDKGDQAFVVHHPDGRPKEVSLDDAEIIGLEAAVIHYSSDTMDGSSGAPVFDRRGRLIGLHHASRAGQFVLSDGTTSKVVNEGIKISAIALDLEARVRRGDRDAAQAETILKEIAGSDTMAGFFGGHGRRVSLEANAAKAIVDTYRGTDQDIDIGFWNIDGFAKPQFDPLKLRDAARVIADLNLDVWGLLGMSESALAGLIRILAARFGDQYACASGAPGAPAVIWKHKVLQGQWVDAWPSTLEPLLRRASGAGSPEDVAARQLFNHYPALFELRSKGGLPEHRFFVVPVHLKAADSGSLARRLAARMLARAVEDLAIAGGADVVLGGVMNAPLGRGDFSAIEDKGFLVVGAQDNDQGAFSYIKAPDSAVDNVYLAPSMRQTVGAVDYFIVARDRIMPDYRGVSDHQPLAARLSLTRSPVAERALDQAALDRMIDDMLGGNAIA